MVLSDYPNVSTCCVVSLCLLYHCHVVSNTCSFSFHMFPYLSLCFLILGFACFPIAAITYKPNNFYMALLNRLPILPQTNSWIKETYKRQSMSMADATPDPHWNPSASRPIDHTGPSCVPFHFFPLTVSLMFFSPGISLSEVVRHGQQALLQTSHGSLVALTESLRKRIIGCRDQEPAHASSTLRKLKATVFLFGRSSGMLTWCNISSLLFTLQLPAMFSSLTGRFWIIINLHFVIFLVFFCTMVSSGVWVLPIMQFIYLLSVAPVQRSHFLIWTRFYAFQLSSFIAIPKNDKGSMQVDSVDSVHSLSLKAFARMVILHSRKQERCKTRQNYASTAHVHRFFFFFFINI